MNLSQPIKYSGGSGKWSLVGPVRCALDNQLIGVCEQFESMSPAERQNFAAQPIHTDTDWTLFTFALRMAVFALRENDPQTFKTGMRGFGLASRHDPRDIMTASAKLIYVALRLGLDPEQLSGPEWIHQPWMRQWFTNVAERNREVDWQSNHWRIREVDTELGVGLINSSGQYHPQTDLLKLAMRICRIVEGDDRYFSTDIQLDQAGRPGSGVWMIANPNPDAHPEMKNQMLHMRLFELASAEQVCQLAEKYRIPSNEAGLFISHDKLVFMLFARSWVSGVANVETDHSIHRFEAPIAAVVRNFHRYQWQTWQAFETDGCVTLTTKDGAVQLKRTGQLVEDARLLYEFAAATGEEASTIHHERQGWEPYKPIGESALCPNKCGSYYYPLGSGDCPVCGNLG